MSRSRNNGCGCWLCSPDERRAKFRDAKRTVDNPKDLVDDQKSDHCEDCTYYVVCNRCETYWDTYDE